MPFILEIPAVNYYDYIYQNTSLSKGAIYKEYEDGPIVIMGHSGAGDAAVFNSIPSLKETDEIYLHSYDGKVSYQVKSKKLIKKNTKVVFENKNDNLYLVTCDLSNYDQQWLILAQKV